MGVAVVVPAGVRVAAARAHAAPRGVAQAALDALRRDVVRLADDVRGEVGMSRAIELARGGATKQAVADATGLSLEEAEAIVTFHGRK